MGEKLPIISGKELLQFYIKMGCELKRVKGSHHVIKSIYNDSMFVDSCERRIRPWPFKGYYSAVRLGGRSF